MILGRRTWAVAALALAALGTPACLGMSKPRGILLITLDTTRPDHLGCYGYTSAVTPQLDALAKESVRFDQAMAAVPTTLASHATMFTGYYPPTHGVRYNGMFRLGDTSVTVAELLKGAGYVTGAVPAAFPVNAKTGIGQGFDTYKDLWSEPGSAGLKASASRLAADVTKLGLETIRAAGDKPFFVWLHYYDPHYPYEPPFPYSSKFRDHPYDGEIAYVDKQLGELFAGLKKDGAWDRIAVIVAGDHGEGLYEHGERMHSQLAYQSTLRVPLLVKTPGASAGSLVREPITLADLAPTILDLAGLKVPKGLDGMSLRPLLKGGTIPVRPLYFETFAGALAFGWSPIEGVRRGPWKLIRGADTELFDLNSDPNEMNDVVRTDATTASDLGAELDADLARWKTTAIPAAETEAPIDAESLARLAALGYVGGTMADARRGGANPRDLVHLESELLLVQDLMDGRQFQRAMLAIPGILKSDPANRIALQSAAEASAHLRDFDQAERYARDVIARYPEYLPAAVTLGRIQVAKKNHPEAEKVFRDGLTRFPDEPVLVYSLAMALVSENRPADAEPLVTRALAGKNPDPGFHVLHALCRASASDLPGAKAALAKAIAGGYPYLDTLRREPIMAPLRAIPDFEETIAPKKAS
jgi:arylsulfatase A-like enzyme